jgi:hypothetical protein
MKIMKAWAAGRSSQKRWEEAKICLATVEDGQKQPGGESWRLSIKQYREKRGTDENRNCLPFELKI